MINMQNILNHSVFRLAIFDVFYVFLFYKNGFQFSLKFNCRIVICNVYSLDRYIGITVGRSVTFLPRLQFAVKNKHYESTK